jgi:hypothetical protein
MPGRESIGRWYRSSDCQKLHPNVSTWFDAGIQELNLEVAVGNRLRLSDELVQTRSKVSIPDDILDGRCNGGEVSETRTHGNALLCADRFDGAARMGALDHVERGGIRITR